MTAEMLEPTESTVEGGVLSDPPIPASVSSGAARDLMQGASALGTAVLLERGFGFLANLLAARLGGAATFGAYSLAITTANNVSTYAAGGIASTAIRFSGRYGRGSAGYRTLAKALLIISTSSAAAGALVLWVGAAPLARVLGKAGLTSLLQWAALSVAGMILLECCRGFLVGQKRIRGIVLLSSTVGLGMVAFLPFLARVGPVPMIAAQGAVTLGAVVLCLCLVRPLSRGVRRESRLFASDPLPAAAPSLGSVPLGPMLREVWFFGLVQLSGLVGLNAAGWWLTSLLARADASMTQMGFLAIASQMRNMASLAPGLLTESSLAVMARADDDKARTPDRVMALCTWATTFASLALAGVGITLIPWMLPLLYGRAYAGATTAAAIALGTAVVHMGSGPVSARVSILSVRTTGVINAIWAVLVTLSAATFLWWGGDAAKASLIYLGAHIVSAALLWFSLRQRQTLPTGLSAVFLTGCATTLGLVVLAALRDRYWHSNGLASVLLLLVTGAGLQTLFIIARRQRWLPDLTQLRQTFAARWSGLRPGKGNANG